MSLKRILNELHNIIPNKLLQNKIYENFTFSELGNDIICRDICVIHNKSNTIIIKFNINENYPFKPPKVYINFNNQDINYLTWLSKLICYKQPNVSHLTEKNYNSWVFSIIRWPLFKKYLKFPTNGTCYCCSSILCNNIWTPSLNLCDILFEYIICRQFLSYSTVLNQKQIDPIFKNEKWTLPNDVIDHIILFL